MKVKKFVAIIMAVITIFAVCSCATADSDKKEPVSTSSVETEKETSKVAEETVETKETEDDSSRNEFSLTQSEMEFIYDKIEENLKKDYLEPNNINVEDFSIPEDSINWEYLARYCMIVYEEPDISDDRLQNLLIELYPLSSENQNIMNIISSSFYNALEELDSTMTVTNFQLDPPLFTDTIKNLIISNVFADTTEEVITK